MPSKQPHELIFLPLYKISTHINEEVPQIHLDQFAVITNHHHATRHNLPPLTHIQRDHDLMYYDTICHGVAHSHIDPRLNQKILRH